MLHWVNRKLYIDCCCRDFICDLLFPEQSLEPQGFAWQSWSTTCRSGAGLGLFTPSTFFGSQMLYFSLKISVFAYSLEVSNIIKNRAGNLYYTSLSAAQGQWSNLKKWWVVRRELYYHWLGGQWVGQPSRAWLVFVSMTAVTDGKMQCLLWTEMDESGSEVRRRREREGDLKGRKEGERDWRRGCGNHCYVTLCTNIAPMLLTAVGEDSS